MCVIESSHVRAPKPCYLCDHTAELTVIGVLGTPLSPYCAVGRNVVPTFLPVLGSQGSVGRMYLVGKREAENAEGRLQRSLGIWEGLGSFVLR